MGTTYSCPSERSRRSIPSNHQRQTSLFVLKNMRHPSSPPSSTRLGDAKVRGEEHGRRLLWGRSGHRYTVVVLAIGQRGLLLRYQRPDALALLRLQREPLHLFVGHAICSLSALPSCWFQELIFHAPRGRVRVTSLFTRSSKSLVSVRRGT